MKKHLLLAPAVIAWAFSSSAFAALPDNWVQGQTRWGNQIVYGPSYSNPVTGQTKPWNTLIGTPHKGDIVDVKPKSVIVKPMAVGKGLVVQAVVTPISDGVFKAINVENTVTQAALIGAVSGLVTGGPGNAVFMGATSALMAYATTGTGVQKNPSFPDSQTTHPFLKTVDDETRRCAPATSAVQLAAIAYANAACGTPGYPAYWNAGNARTSACYYGCGNGSGGFTDYLTVPKLAISGSMSVPATWADVVNDVDLKGNPTPTTLEGALDYGAHPDMTTTVSGPAQTEGPSEETTETTQNPDGTTSTTTITNKTVNNHTYNNNVVTTNTTKTTEKTNPDGTKVITVTKPEAGKDEVPEPPPTDTPLGEVPDLYERQYPDGMEGVWNTYKDQLQNTSLATLASKLMPNIPDGGTCPQWPINLDMAQWAAFGTHDVAPPCYIWGIAKAILIVSALLLARALIFGG